MERGQVPDGPFESSAYLRIELVQGAVPTRARNLGLGQLYPIEAPCHVPERVVAAGAHLQEDAGHLLPYLRFVRGSTVEEKGELRA